MDCFCGLGTTLAIAQELNHKCIGIDQSEHAIKAARGKMASVPQNLFSVKGYEFLAQKQEIAKSCKA